MAEPLIDLSEIINLYKEDAVRMIDKMKNAVDRWSEVQQGGPARAELRKLSHQMRGSGRTYGFRNVTRKCKAIENMVQRLEKGTISADDRVKASIRSKIEGLVVAFKDA